VNLLVDVEHRDFCKLFDELLVSFNSEMELLANVDHPQDVKCYQQFFSR
jgi:hypothetical protein